MKIVFYLLAFLTLTAADAQTQASDCRKPSQSFTGYRGAPKSVSHTSSIVTATGASDIYRVESRLNAGGYPVNIREYANGTLTRTTEVTYYRDGLPLTIRTFNSTGALHQENRFDYNDAGYIIKETTLDKGETEPQVNTYSYERLPDNSLLRTSTLSGNSRLSLGVKNWYRQTAYNPDGTVAYDESSADRNFVSGQKTTYRYDADKKVTAMVTVSINGKSTEQTETAMQYDAYGNVTRDETKGAGYPAPDIRTYTFTYDAAKNPTATYRNGELMDEAVFQY